MTRFLTIILVLLLVALPTRIGAEDEPAGKSGSPYERYLPGTEPDNVVAVRVMRLAGGRATPVKGARVTGWSEEAKEADIAQARLLAEGRSDEYGFVNVTWKSEVDRPFHWLVEAPGMAVRAFSPDGDVFLAPGAPYALRVLAPMGRPLEGARVEYYIYGCPHSPSARVGTTDAEGHVLLTGLPDPRHVNADARNEWGQFWILAEGVEPGPYCERPPAKPGSPATLLTRRGASAQGVVRGEKGTPKAGIVVREIGYPRGPATTTDAQGRFRLFGLSSSSGIAFYDPRDLLPGRPNAVVQDFAPDVPILLTLRAGRATALGQGDTREVAEVEVLVRYSSQSPPSAKNDVPVRFARLSDGLVVVGKTGDPTNGLFRTLLPPGRYRVVVGGAFSPVVRATREIDVPTAKPERFVLDKAASLVLRGLDPSDPEWVGLLLPDGSESATDGLPHLLSLPPDGPAAIQLDRGGPVVLPVGPLKDGFRLASVPTREPVTIRLRLKSADPDHPLEYSEVRWADDQSGEEEEGQADDAGRWALTTYWRGRRVLTAGSSGFQDEIVEVTLGPEAREVDVGDVLLHPLRKRTLRVVDDSGAVVRDLSLHWGSRGEFGNELQEEDGTFSLELGPRPVPAVLRGAGIYPQPLRLGAKGPSEVRLPAGRVVIHVRDTKGRPLEAVVYLDHARVSGKQGDHALRGIPAGVHTVIVGAPAHVGALRRIEVRGDKPQTVAFTLSPR